MQQVVCLLCYTIISPDVNYQPPTKLNYGTTATTTDGKLFNPSLLLQLLNDERIATSIYETYKFEVSREIHKFHFAGGPITW